MVAEAIRRAKGEMGIEKLMWGSDWPRKRLIVVSWGFDTANRHT